MELMCLFNARNSFFVDAPLSDRGLEQVEELRKFLNKVNDPFLTDAEVAALRSKHVDVLRADAARGREVEQEINHRDVKFKTRGSVPRRLRLWIGLNARRKSCS